MEQGSSHRRKYIREHYSLQQNECNQWVAMMRHQNIVGPVLFVEENKIIGNRNDVVFEARCRWGHFNFDDETEEFDGIFNSNGQGIT
jgi:hypothetical protein